MLTARQSPQLFSQRARSQAPHATERRVSDDDKIRSCLSGLLAMRFNAGSYVDALRMVPQVRSGYGRSCSLEEMRWLGSMSISRTRADEAGVRSASFGPQS
jgi:hypothetical protein